MRKDNIKRKIFTWVSVLALVLPVLVLGIHTHAQTVIRGDMNNDTDVNTDDATYLLRYILMPDTYPITQSGDMNGDGTVNVDDALYLLRHITMPDEYPLICEEHDFGEWIQTKAPTCTEKGEEKRTCKNCDHFEIRDVAALGHNEVSHAAKTPTCTEIGWDAYVTCSRCDYTTYVEKAALGHEYVDGVCKNCGQEIQPSEGLKYTLNSDGESYRVSGIGSCTDTDIVIPSIYNGKPVTRIGDYAFWDCSSLTSIKIPNSVTSIGDDAFYDCRGLTSVNIPDSVTSIGAYAFLGCSSLTDIEIPNGVTGIGRSAFCRCSSLMSIEIPDSVTSIGDYAFELCSSLTSITIGNSVTRLTPYEFSYCRSLTSINFKGTKAQWNAIIKGDHWNYNTGSYTIYCTDGTISK